MKIKNKEVYIVHAVDTEGPLYESKKATIQRIKELTGIKIKESELKKIFENDILKSKNKFLFNKLSKIFSPHLLNYNSNWSSIKKMLDKISTNKFRNELKDFNNNGYVLTWHCLDHLNYKTNLRKKVLGHSKIFNFYKNYLKTNKTIKDDIQFHFHPISIFREGNRNASLFFRNDNIYQILSRRIIDHCWFPVAHRAGFHIERPDANWFLNQFIPFDLSNTNKNMRRSDSPAKNAFGSDWRRAPSNWEIYSPDENDYQKKGKSRRFIGRVLSIMNRTESIDLKEVNKAFKRANEGKKTLLAVTSHDFRNLKTEINFFRSLIKKSSKKFPKVKFYFVDTVKGFQKTLSLKNIKKNSIKLNIKRINKNSFKFNTTNGKVFGPQPFLAIKLKNGKYIHDNFDFGLKANEWFYTFCEDTVNLDKVKVIAVAASDSLGNFDVKKYNL
jgi:hypothetical protein